MLQSLLEAKTSPPLLYQGTGLIADSDNPLILCLLSASTSAYTYNPDQLIKEYPHGVGKNNILLIAALQARNNARVLFSGSIFIFSDEAFTSPTQKGQAAYTIMDDVVYSIDVEQLSGGKWVPYETNNLQLEIGICYKPKPILDILLRNQKLIEFLTRFHTDRSEDEQLFNDEKTYLIKQIKELKSVHDN